ncbi:MAG: hypothetical protein QM500_15865 [Methylococcales bacterium]
MSEIKLDKIADILPPSVPVSNTDNLWQVAIILIIIIILSAYIYYYRSNKQKLRRLKKFYQNKIISQRQLALKVSDLLKRNSVSIDKDLNAALHQTLQAARFSRNGIDKNSMIELIQRVEKWI